MDILFCASEVTPFAKTGGLADVIAALPAALAARGHRVAVVCPLYQGVRRGGYDLRPTGVTFEVPIGSRLVRGGFLEATIPRTDVPVYFVGQDEFYDRPALYGPPDGDYPDNSSRFLFLARATLEAVRLLDFPAEVIHGHDWQAGMVGPILKIDYPRAVGYEAIASVMTIHNILFQGWFWAYDMHLTGLGWEHFRPDALEHHGQLNFMKAGLAFADGITTVSRTYAHEIQTPEYAYGLEGLLRHRARDVAGIVNGLDRTVWDPAADAALPETYTVETWAAGKRACRAHLQAEFGLPVEADVPILAHVGRLTDQKGWDLIIELMRRWLPGRRAQFVVLGSGEERYHHLLAELAQQFPDKLAVRHTFSEPLAHRIIAGADVFLMPSRFEPCGLAQLQALRYGTPPIVRRTGGLADTVVDATPEAIALGEATGFVFDGFDVQSFEHAVERALATRLVHGRAWSTIIEQAMRADFSWDVAASQYEAVYEAAIARAAEQARR